MMPDSTQNAAIDMIRRQQTVEERARETGPVQQIFPAYGNMEWSAIKRYLDSKFAAQGWTNYNESYVSEDNFLFDH
jgi:hypothetical protein